MGPGTTLFACLLLLAVFAGCTTESRPDKYEQEETDSFEHGLSTPQGVERRVVGAIDSSVPPCTDFYQYACGGWLKHASLWLHQGISGFGLLGVQEYNQVRLWNLLDKATAATNGPQAELATFYQACMDQAANEAVGLAPLAPVKEAIRSVHDGDSLMRAVGVLHRIGVPALFKITMTRNPKRPDAPTLLLEPAPFGLIVRNWYLTSDLESKQSVELYTAHIARTLALDGDSSEQAAAEARAVVDFERALAADAPTPVEQHSRTASVTYYGQADFDRLVAPLPIARYFASADFQVPALVAVTSPQYFSGLARTTSEADPSTLQSYLRWQLLHWLVWALPARFREAHFAFYNHALFHQDFAEPPWNRCVTLTEQLLGDQVAQVYLDETAPGAAAQATALAAGLRVAAAARLANDDWLDPAARQRATEKIRAVTIRLGHPATGSETESLALSPHDNLQNVLLARQRNFDRMVHATDAADAAMVWSVSPFDATGFYRDGFNDLLIPIGLLQAPLFDPRLTAPLNYGALGAIIGHEFFHALDGTGRGMNAIGQSIKWEAPTQQVFDEQMKCMTGHFSQYEAIPASKTAAAVPVNALRTANENLADIAGVAAAYDAYRAHVAESGEPPVTVDHLTGDQLFFVAYAQTWCAKLSPSYARLLAHIDEHAPPEVRVNGALSEVPAFAAAFGCPAGSPMRPSTLCRSW